MTDTVYSYDTSGRLDAVTVDERFDTPLGTPEVTDYVYDLVGNLAQTQLASDKKEKKKRTGIFLTSEASRRRMIRR